jgi:hypothetical protein
MLSLNNKNKRGTPRASATNSKGRTKKRVTNRISMPLHAQGNNKVCAIIYNRVNMMAKDMFPRVVFFRVLCRRLREIGYSDIKILRSDYVAEIVKLSRIDLVLFMEDFYMFANYSSAQCMLDTWQFFSKLSQSVLMYPSPEFNIYTNSKQYFLDLPSRLFLPHTQFFKLDSDVAADIKEKQYAAIVEYGVRLLQRVKRIVIKIGYSANGDNLYMIGDNSKDDVKMMETVVKKYVAYVKQHRMGVIVCVQPYNVDMIRTNEYRCWFIEGEFVGYFCFGIIKSPTGSVLKLLDNIRYNAANAVHRAVLRLAESVYKTAEFIKQYKPIALRIDISFTCDSRLQDSDSRDIRGVQHRFYCNELENIDGTYYFNIPVVAADSANESAHWNRHKLQHGKKGDTVRQQKKLAAALIKWIQQNEKYTAL